MLGCSLCSSPTVSVHLVVKMFSVLKKQYVSMNFQVSLGKSATETVFFENTGERDECLSYTQVLARVVKVVLRKLRHDLR